MVARGRQQTTRIPNMTRCPICGAKDIATREKRCKGACKNKVEKLEMNRTLWWDPTGPRFGWDHSTLYISDLNPEINIMWSMTRWELAKIGLLMLRAALFR